MFQSAVNSKANYYFIKIGTNDTPDYDWNEENWVKVYTELIQMLQKQIQSPKVFVITNCPAYSEGHKDIRQVIVNEVLQDRCYPKLAALDDVSLIDVFNKLGGKSLSKREHFIDDSQPMQEWKNDGIHPHDSG